MIKNQYPLRYMIREQERKENENSRAGMGTICIWATYSFLWFQCLFKPDHVQYLFHLMMEYWCAFQTLWLNRPDNTQFMICGSGCMVTSCPVVKHSICTKAQQLASVVSQKRTIYLWLMVGVCSKILCCNSPIEACQRFQIASSSATDSSNTIVSSGLNGWRGRVACMAVWTCHRVFSCSWPIND